jgi:hypothetical protein
MQLVHVVPRDVLHDTAARLRHGPVNVRDAQADDPVADGAVRVPQRPESVRRDQSAHGRVRSRRRVERQPLAVLREHAAQRFDGHACTDRNSKVVRFMLDRASEPGC